MKTGRITPLSLAVPPSATAEFSQPAYDSERQYGVSRDVLKSNPVMTRATTQTFDAKGNAKDSDQD